MSYSHAEANLVATLALEQETAQLLRALAETDPERARQLCEGGRDNRRLAADCWGGGDHVVGIGPRRLSASTWTHLTADYAARS
jgi:hypothetical protein